jgi:hypothetical protein
MVIQKKENITLYITIRSMNYEKLSSYARNLHPFDRNKRQALFQDIRKANNRENRLNDLIRKRKYVSALLQKQVKSKNEFRMFVVQKRDAKTLLPIIKRNAAPGSDIHSDEWRAYGKLNSMGYNHFTVNHKENFVNPSRVKHTQLVECLWGVNKRKIPNRIRGKSCYLLQTY